jgi:lipopolysaccharide transport system ATP-binding protein
MLSLFFQIQGLKAAKVCPQGKYMSDIAVQTEHLSKMYRLGVINNGTFFRDVETWIALKRGKEDPHSKIGENKYNNDDDHFWALKDLNLEIKQGDRVGIIGKNGAGKSTLLKLLSRITAPTEGTIKIKGKIASLLEVGTGFHGELTGRENIYLNGAILGMKKRRITEKLDEIIAFSGIEHHIDTPVKRYSSGMYVRLAFAVAAHLDSDILIADEVLAVGDAEFQKKALGKMQDLSTGQGRTVLFVSHNMGAVKNLCNCGVILQNGRIVAESSNILELTKTYLQNSQEKISCEWHNDGKEFDNPYFKPIDFYLADAEGKIIDESIGSDSTCWVYISGEVKEVDNTLCVGYVIHNDDGVLLYWSYQIDVEQKDWPKLHTGVCKLKSKIPEHLLNEGDYRLELVSCLYYRFWINESGINAPSIQLSIRGGLSDSPYFPEKRSGIIAPIIPWNLEVSSV